MPSGRSEVRVFQIDAAEADPVANTPVLAFQPFGPRFAGGASVALADVGTFVGGVTQSVLVADGNSELVVASGAGMRATVLVYDMSASRPRLVDTINPFRGSASVGGLTVATGRVDADQIQDLIISSGQGGRSQVEVFSGRIDDRVDTRLLAVSPFANSKRRNASVTSVGIDANQDGIVDSLTVGQGSGGELGQVRQLALATGVRAAAAAVKVGAPQTPLRVAALNNRPLSDVIPTRARQAIMANGIGTVADRQAAFAELSREWGVVNGVGFRRVTST